MFGLPRLLARAIQAWWREFVFLLILNFLWLLAQFTVVLAAPATAGFVAVARQIVDRELVDFGDFWRAVLDNLAAEPLHGRHPRRRRRHVAPVGRDVPQ